jgi:hypothetical protein
MAKVSSETPKKKRRVTASGLVEAIEQDVELSAEQIKDAAHEAVVAVEKKLGVGKAAPPKSKVPRAPKDAGRK